MQVQVNDYLCISKIFNVNKSEKFVHKSNQLIQDCDSRFINLFFPQVWKMNRRNIGNEKILSIPA